MDSQTHCDNFQTESSFGGGCQGWDQGGHDQQGGFDPTMADLTNMMGHTQVTAGGDGAFGGHGGLSLLWRTWRRTFASCDIAIEQTRFIGWIRHNLKWTFY